MTKASDNVFSRFLVSEGGSTSTPAANRVTVYAKADGLLYQKDDAGVETLLAGGSGGAPTTAQYIVGALDGSLSAEKVRADIYQNYHPDNYPTSGLNAVSNEFDGGAGGTYTWTTSPGSSDEDTTFPGHLYVPSATNSGNVYYRAAYAPGATDFTVAAKFEAGTFYNVSQTFQFGLAVLDTSDVAIWRMLVIDDATNDYQAHLRYNDTNVGTIALSIDGTQPVYMLLQRTSGNVYTAYLSLNGKAWMKTGSSTVATTVEKVAIVNNSAGTEPKVVIVDFIRVFNSLLTTFKIGA